MTGSATTGGATSSQRWDELTTVKSTSVLRQINKVYGRDWKLVRRAREDRDRKGALLPLREEDKAALVSLMMYRRHQDGKSGEGATASTVVAKSFSASNASKGFSGSAIHPMPVQRTE